MTTALLQNAYMSNKPKKKDRHTKAGFQMRLHPLLRQQLERAVELHASSISEEVRLAIRERLERLKLWPADVKESSSK